jgi:hypothetical protein
MICLLLQVLRRQGLEIAEDFGAETFGNFDIGNLIGRLEGEGGGDVSVFGGQGPSVAGDPSLPSPGTRFRRIDNHDIISIRRRCGWRLTLREMMAGDLVEGDHPAVELRFHPLETGIAAPEIASRERHPR